MRLSKYKLASIALNPFIGPVNTENFISYIKNPYSRWEDEYGCIFVHVPKSAGKAVTLSLFGAPNGTGHNKITCYERYPEKFKNYRKVTVVRNPWDRLVSAFFYIKNFDKESNDRKFFDRYIGQKTEFRDFVMRLSDYDYRNVVFRWQHFAPQYKFLVNRSGSIDFDFIGRFENLKKDYEVLKSIVNPSAGELKKVNSSKRDNYKLYYDDEMVDIVRRIYHFDVELFKYDF